MKILKSLSPLISPPFSHIINESFQSGIFPDKMKFAKVIPLFKKGCPLAASNYRPISLLSVSSKITEEVMYERLYKFLEKHEILYSLQCGFRASHSINHALVSLTEAIKNSLDNRKFGCGPGGGNFNRRVTGVRHLTSETHPKIFVNTIPQNLQAIENAFPKIVTANQNFNLVSEI